MARTKRRTRSRSEKVMIVIGLLVAVSMVLGTVISMM